jgi:hypothetical protein
MTSFVSRSRKALSPTMMWFLLLLFAKRLDRPLLVTPFIQEYRYIIDPLFINPRLYGHLSLRLLADFLVIHQPRNQQLKIARQGLTF